MKQNLGPFCLCLLFLLVCVSAAGQVPSSRQRNIAVGNLHWRPDSTRVGSLNVGLLSHADTVHGLQLGLLASTVNHDMRGVLVGGLTSIADHFQGLQLSLLSNVNRSPLRKGVQVAAISNISMGVQQGTQLSALANVCSSYMRGLQIGTYNYADTINGLQLGLFNACVQSEHGIQIGLVNYSRDSTSRRYGLINVSPLTQPDLMLFGGSETMLNGAVRFRNRSTYNIIGLGTHYQGFNHRYAAAVFYRIGQYFQISPRWSLSGDLGFCHIESFREASAPSPARLFALQARFNADYRVGRGWGVFATAGYGDTRHYHHGRSHRHKPFMEAGLTFSLNRSDYDAAAGPLSAYADAGNDSTMTILDINVPIRRKPWLAAGEVVLVNGFVHSFDRFVTREDFAQNNIHHIRNNFHNAFVWDNDNFNTNLFAHPYHGNLYFTSARSNGMSYWQSIPYAMGGSLMWEFFGETTPPAINDFMATSLGGTCIGEIAFRVSALALDDSQRGMSRVLHELLGAVVSPMRAFNRLLTGDAWRVRQRKYHDYNRIPVTFTANVGYRYVADRGSFSRGESTPYIDFQLNYGDAFDDEENHPFDYFTADVTFSPFGSQPLVSAVHLLGRIWAAPVIEDRKFELDFGIFQHFNFFNSEPVKDGSNEVPYRISEAAAVGPGFIYRLPRIGHLTSLQQQLFVSGILLGGSLSDHLHVQERDYNMGSGFSVKLLTELDFSNVGRFSLRTDFYSIYTWKGYDPDRIAQMEDLDYTNTQGEVGSAQLLVLNPRLQISLNKRLSLDLYMAYYLRRTNYRDYPTVQAHTYEMRFGLSYRM